MNRSRGRGRVFYKTRVRKTGSKNREKCVEKGTSEEMRNRWTMDVLVGLRGPREGFTDTSYGDPLGVHGV